VFIIQTTDNRFIEKMASLAVLLGEKVCWWESVKKRERE
jgi:hypothetical protein